MSIVEGLQQAGPYQIQERLSSNGVVATFRATDVNRGHAVFVTGVAESDLEKAASWSAFQQLFNELVTNPRPKAVRPVQCGEMPGVKWAAYEFVEGLHVGEAVRDSGLPSPSQALQILAQTMEALEGFHKSGVIHGAISPSSIFINTEQEILLHHAGWSAMVLAVRDGAKNPAFVSNLPFLAPEVVSSGEAGEASDIYSLGANLYFLLTGTPLFWADTLEEIAEGIAKGQPDLGPLKTVVGDDVTELVEELLENDPDDRPLNLSALMTRVAGLAEAYAARESSVEEESIGEVGINSLDTVRGVVPVSSGTIARPDSPPPAEGPPPPPGLPPSEGSPGPPSVPPPPAPPAASTPPAPRTAPRNAPEAPAQSAPGPRPVKKSGPGKVIVVAGLGVVFLIVVVAALMLFMGGGDEGGSGSRDAEAAESGSNSDSGGVADPGMPTDIGKRDTTLRRLAELGRIHKRFAQENGIWASTMAELKDAGASDDLTMDAWNNEFDIRKTYLVSAGADRKWQTDDELWIDAESGVTGP